MDAYCTCNDDKMHGTLVTKHRGKETTVCPDATATMDGIESGTPTADPSCYLTHGPPHDNPDEDELIKICMAGKSEFAAVCRTEIKKDIGISVGCPGQWSGRNDSPVKNNHYNAWFERANDVPEDCDYLFRQGDFDDDNEVGIRVDALCIPVFKTIRDKCTWNRGEVKNQCGTFKYQSCSLGVLCKWGSP